MSVLHPAYKLEYFKSAKWDLEWIEVAEAPIQTEFNCHYTSLPTTDSESEDDVSEVNEIDNQVCS